MKNFFHHHYDKVGNFREEFKKQIRLTIIITLGFTIAFTWRQTIFDLSEALIETILDIRDDATLSILTSTFITVVSVLLIYITSRILKEETNY